MKLRFLGHAAFALELGGVKLCLDPHKPGVVGGRFHLPPIVGPFDAIASTHPHEDHSAWTPELGTMTRIEGDAIIGAVQVRSRPVFHDTENGLRSGLSTMLSFEAEGVRVVHCGDVCSYDDADVAWLRGTDVLLVPVGGKYTLDGAQAAELVRAVAPKMAMPMHAADPRIDLPLAPLDTFLLYFQDQPWQGAELVWTADATVPAPIVVLAGP
jgi:L-ascorbate metabolism protein UlaG (beta-lactamase superfamily)